MYSEAHRSYDLINTFLSLNTDSIIRRKAAEAAISSNPSNLLDIATGTGDLAIMAAKLAEEKGIKTRVIAIDVNANMLKVAREKAAKLNAKNIIFEKGNALSLKYKSGFFDAAVCSFALKNFDSQEKFLKEANRVLKNNGTFVIIDISRPESSTGRLAFGVYMNYMRLFGIITGKKLYKWLPGSTSAFDRKALISKIKAAGFRDIKKKERMFGIAYVLSCRK